MRLHASPFGQGFREVKLCFTTHFYNPETQISFVEHDDLVLVCAIIKHMSEIQKHKQHRIRVCSSLMLCCFESRWLEQNKSHSGRDRIRFLRRNSCTLRLGHNRGQQARRSCSDSFLHVTRPFLRKKGLLQGQHFLPARYCMKSAGLNSWIMMQGQNDLNSQCCFVCTALVNCSRYNVDMSRPYPLRVQKLTYCPYNRCPRCTLKEACPRFTSLSGEVWQICHIHALLG